MPAHPHHPGNDPETPDLRIVPLDLLVEHEYNDVQRTEPLARRLEAEGLLKNPPLVTPMEGEDDDPRLVVLDGANRTTALGMLGYRHCLVQVVRYQPPHVSLSTWHHLITGIQLDDFAQAIGGVQGLACREIDLLHARAGLARRDFISYILRADGKVYGAAVDGGPATIHEKNALLNAMVDTYKERGRLFRASAENLSDARRLYLDLTALVVFPNFEPAEVMALARDGELLPTGLTRHLIQGRALRLNYPLTHLKSDESLEEKNARLADWIRAKMTGKEMRFYAESTYLFDE